MTVLRGTLNQSLSFVGRHFAQLVKVSCIPILIIELCLAITFIISVIIFHYDISSGQNENQVLQNDAHILLIIIKYLSISLFIISSFLVSYVCVRTIRYCLLGEGGWFRMDRKLFKASWLWIIQVLKIDVAVGAAYLVVGLVVAVLNFGITLALHLGDMVFMVLGTGALLCAMLLVIVTVGPRLAIGLPDVALSLRMRRWRSLWRLSQGLTWQLAGRASVLIMAALLIGFIVLSACVMIYAPQPLFSGSGRVIAQSLTLGVITANAILVLAGAPLLWWMLCWLCLVYKRLMARRRHAPPGMASR